MGKLEKVSWVGIAGTFLILEGIASAMWSQDKEPLSQAGRATRVIIGIGLLTVKICS